MNTTTLTGAATYFLEPDTNTDIIIPARFLKRVHLTGFTPFAFYEKKYLPDTICEASLTEKDFVFKKTVLDPAFPPNHPHASDATFLLTWLNFGCGSSREHAVYSLNNYKVIIGSAPPGQNAFADIFRDNCRQNLIWTPVISEVDHKTLVAYLKNEIPNRPALLSLHPAKRRITSSDGNIDLPYSIPEHHETYILSGTDPATIAKQEIESAKLEIANWRNNNPAIVNHYPNAKL
ncbi:hypothetical protein COTS27_01680 [Spirochaetota bacterium]|nr:hypothetical protein COTS27_01680 [Spirochaetota bacterium]